ncbi:MAG: cell division protein FtsA [Puniceicoccaceae bacterium]
MGSKIVAAVDPGTEKVAVLVGEVEPSGTLNIITQVTRPAAGVRRGQVLQFKQAATVVEEALGFAEVEASVRIETVYLGQSGGHLEGIMQGGSARSSGVDGSVTASDVARAVEEAKKRQLGPNRVFIHHIQNPFRLDGEVVERPEGLRGDLIEVDYWSVHGDSRKVSDMIHIINGFGLKVRDVIISSVASGCVTASEDARQAGCLVLDMGAGTTDYVLYRGGYILRTGVVPVGGDHLVNDLAIGMRMNVKRAKEILHEMGRAMVSREDKTEWIRIYGDNLIGDRSISRNGMDRIVEVRLQEVFEIVKGDLGNQGRPECLAGGVFITGGVSRLARIDLLAKAVFGVPVETSMVPEWVDQSLRGPEFSTVLGILHYALTGEMEAHDGNRQPEKGFLRKLMRSFQK